MSTLRIYLEPDMLRSARQGSFNFLNQLRTAVESIGWRVEWRPTGPAARLQAPLRGGYALFHMERPTHDRALTFRRAYHYPFWHIESVSERWRWPVAQAHFDPASIDPDQASAFASRLRARVLPDAPGQGEHVLIPLQGRISQTRSFQTMSPLAMVEAVAQTGRPAIVTLHPREAYSPDERAALDALAQRYPNVQIGADDHARALRDCAFVATQNSSVAFDGYLLGKPAVLFAQIDFHHIALNVADMGVKAALAAATTHRPDFDRYLFWFLRGQSIQATAPDAPRQILRAMAKGGWPIPTAAL